MVKYINKESNIIEDAKKLRESLNGYDWLIAVGVGEIDKEQCIFVYTKKIGLGIADKIPSISENGFIINRHVLGKIKTIIMGGQ